MESRIKVEYDRANKNLPIISINRKFSDDVRDQLLSDFILELKFDSNWLRIDKTHEDREFHYYKISPIDPDNLREQAKEMLKRAEEIDARKKMHAEQLIQRAEEISK